MCRPGSLQGREPGGFFVSNAQAIQYPLELNFDICSGLGAWDLAVAHTPLQDPSRAEFQNAEHEGGLLR